MVSEELSSNESHRRAHLGSRNQRVLNEELSPLVHNLVMLLEERNRHLLANQLRPMQRHEDHVTTLLDLHRLIIAVVVSKGVGVDAQVVNAPLVRVEAALGVLEDGEHEEAKHLGVEVGEEGELREDDVYGGHVAVA